MPDIQRDLTRSTLAILCIAGLLGLSLWVLRPFLAATVWAAMIVVATWPLFLALEKKLRRRWPAVLIMTAGMLLLLVIPFWLAIDTLASHADQLTALAESLSAGSLPQAPEWLSGLPWLGETLANHWNLTVAAGLPGLLGKMTPHAAEAGKWLLGQVGGLGGALIQFMLVLVMAAILYAEGEAAASLILRFGRRLAGRQGEQSVILAGQAIRGVALGVGVTAIVQTVLAGLGLAVAGIPFASLLSAVLLMLCIAQIGPMPVLLPAVAWMYGTGASGWATFLLIWSLLVGGLDNFLRPALIKRGADLPLLLIFAGVIGGMLGFGLIGLFVGPVVLAVTYTLLLAWMAESGKPAV